MFFERRSTAWRIATLLCTILGSAGCDQSAAPSSPSASSGWTIAIELAGLDLTTVWGTGSDVFAAGGGSQIAHSGDGGTTWHVTDASGVIGASRPTFRHIAGSGGDDVWIAGSAGDESVLLRSADHGSSWQRREVGDLRRLNAVWAIDPNRLLLGTGDGALVRSEDGGVTWTSVATAPGATINAIWGSSASHIAYAVGARAVGMMPGGGEVTASTGCGDTPATDGSAGEGVLLRSPDDGLTWSPIGVAPAAGLSSVWGVGVGSFIVAGGPHESVILSNDGGATWTAEARLLSPLDLTNVWVDANGATFFATASGVVVDLEFSCEGPVNVLTESLPAASGGARGTVALWGSPDGALWAVGPGGIIRSRRNRQ